jgi:hypothetical protein
LQRHAVMSTAGLFTVIAVVWLVACALVVWLIWTAARRDSGTPGQDTAPEMAEHEHPVTREDRAA